MFRKAWATGESVRYSRLGPSQRQLNVQVLIATTVPLWKSGPPESPKQTLLVILMNLSGNASLAGIAETTR